MADMDQLMLIADEAGVPIVEDAAHAMDRNGTAGVPAASALQFIQLQNGKVMTAGEAASCCRTAKN